MDFASQADMGASTKTKRPWIMAISGNTQIVEPEFGRSDQGRFKIQLLDRAGELVKYFANPPLTLNGGIDAVVTTIPVNQDTTGYPALGTIEILTGGVRERVRYLDRTIRSFIGCTRGVDGTTAASHSSGDGVSNGEQIRRGTRAQLFDGFAELDEAKFTSVGKYEVVGRAAGQDRVSVILTIADINRRPSRATVFLTASQTAPRYLCGNPIDLDLAMLLSQGTFATQTGTIAKTAGSAAILGAGTTFTSLTVGDILRTADGELLRVSVITDNTNITAAQNAILTSTAAAFRKGGTNGKYDVLDAVDALGLPSAFVESAAFEALRTSDFATDQYQFDIVQPHNGKTFHEQQFMRTMNCYSRINQTGQLSILRYRVAVGVPTVTLDRDVIRAYDWLPADDQIINSVQFRWDVNVPGALGQYGTFVEYLAGTPTDFTSSVGQFGRVQPLTIEAMGWRSSLGASTLAAARAKQVTDRFAFPQTVVMLDCHYLVHHLEVGDQVYVNDPRIPNIRLGSKGITNEVFEVLDISVSRRPYFVRLTLLWVAAIPTVPAPVSQGVVSTGSPFLIGPVTVADLDRTLGIESGSFAYYHKGVFTGSSPRQSWREASLEFAYVQTSGDRLEYDQYFIGTDPAKTVGAVDVAAIERGPENAASATATTLVLNAAASASDDVYNNMKLEILSNGTPAANGQVRNIDDYTGSTKTATVATWTTTPTGTISYRVIRLGSQDFGNDQHGVSAKPNAAVAAALEQWHHRIIALPAAWNGKTLIEMATAMDGAPASVTQEMLIRNPRITNAAGVLQRQLTRAAFTDQSVWRYGTEANVTATVRFELGGGADPTGNIISLAVGRGGLAELTANVSSASSSDATETVLVTFAAFHEIRSSDDVVRWELHAMGSAQRDSGSVGQDIRFRVRRAGLTGPILAEFLINVTDGSGAGKGGTGTGTFASFSVRALFGLYRAAAAGPEDIVLTYQRITANITSTVTWNAGTVFRSFVKSA